MDVGGGGEGGRAAGNYLSKTFPSAGESIRGEGVARAGEFGSWVNSVSVRYENIEI